ncbi:proline dehydrogenase family protein, partial [Roseisolibacter sp. H3M3-2]|uniref:proline dehydrogenase family protein n=1 Tax=Roseisolibacter sp. H3M3-2 TaxID=3031323 RepID=UPI0023DAC677
MLRNALLYLSNQQAVFRFVRHNGLAKRFASRFVAGETIEGALDAVAALNGRGIRASLDLLGESVTNAGEARETGREYVRLLEAIRARGLDANVSVKLTAMGQDVDEALCVETIGAVLDTAKRHGNFVRLDMESSAYTQRTLDLFYDRLYPAYPENVGIVLQSYLFRTDDDVAAANAARCRVRICKGAYKEPPAVAYPEKADVDASYVRAMHALMREGRYPGLATHDEAIIAEAKRYAKAEGIGPERYEFQMLYGVRRDLQDALVREGYNVRVYVPFGTQWYPYLMRRLAERPANLAFMTGSIVKEALGGRRAGKGAPPPPARAAGDASAHY